MTCPGLFGAPGRGVLLCGSRLGPNLDQMNIKILQTMISGISLILGLGIGMSDPYVYVVFWAPT